MKNGAFCLAIAVGLLLGTEAPAAAQMWFFPDFAVPSASEAPTTFLAGTYGRGLNENSGEVDAFGGVIGRTGEQVSFMGGIGFITGSGDDELTLGGAVGVDVARGESATVSVQGGAGWISLPGLTDDLTLLRFPLGVAVKGNVTTTEASITPWVMPRLNVTRASFGGSSETETDFGASGGLTFTFPGGFGVHTALDMLSGDGGQAWTFGMGAHFMLGAER